MLEIPYPLVTERLELRRFAAEDLDPFYAYEKLVETARYGLHDPFSYEECMRRVGLYAQQNAEKEGDWTSFAIRPNGSAKMVGHIALKWGGGGLEGSSPERVGELGWTLDPAAQGHGYATEAARAVMEFALNDLGFRRIEAHIDVRNDASAAVCERLGMTREAILVDNMYLKGEWTTEAIYAVVRP